MSTTILEALQNARYNFVHNPTLGKFLAHEQLNNAIELFERGYGIYDEIEPLLEEYGQIENVPEKKVADKMNIQYEWFKKGQNSVFRKNKSGCCCIIDDNDNIVSACDAHKKWRIHNFGDI